VSDSTLDAAAAAMMGVRPPRKSSRAGFFVSSSARGRMTFDRARTLAPASSATMTASALWACAA